MNFFNMIKRQIPLIFFILIILIFAKSFRVNRSIQSPLLGLPMPAFNLPSLYEPNIIITKKDFHSHYTLVNVWASWCSACENEHAVLLEIAKDKDIQLIGLNYKDDISHAKETLRLSGNPYRFVGIDPNGNTAIDWGVYGIPETFLIDKNGIIIYKKVGGISFEEWKHKIKPLIKSDIS